MSKEEALQYYANENGLIFYRGELDPKTREKCFIPKTKIDFLKKVIKLWEERFEGM